SVFGMGTGVTSLPSSLDCFIMYLVLKLFTCPSRQELLYNVFSYCAILFYKKKKLLLLKDIFVKKEKILPCKIL
ncbi:MAG: hypothetical protein M3Z79_22295, partial [Lysinibacillus fusiformis]|nr:hypothetical protein [Lysinibacillus fusiformis]